MKINQNITIVFIVLFIFLLMGCDHEDDNDDKTKNPTADVEGSHYYSSQINSGRLSGDTIGSGTNDTSVLRKKLDVVIENPNENIQLKDNKYDGFLAEKPIYF